MTWIVGMDPYADEQGYIIRRKPPEFLAKWAVEDDDFATLSDLVYTDAAYNDAIAIYDFEWTDEMPSEALFRSVCADAVQAIDEYLNCVSGLKNDMKDME